MIRRAQIAVSGIVQGVYYRYQTKRKADELGLSGTVKNLPDGSVGIVTEGEEDVVASLVEWCRRGPRGAVVERVDVRWEEPSGAFEDFSIIY